MSGFDDTSRLIRQLRDEFHLESRIPARDESDEEVREPLCIRCAVNGESVGWVRVERDGYTVTEPCICTIEKRRRKNYEAGLVSSGLGAGKYREYTFGNWTRKESDDPRSSTAAHDLVEAWTADPVGWLLLWGERGLGKTHLVCAAGHALLDAGYGVHFADCSDLIPELRDKAHTGGAYGRMQSVREHDILILDDVGSHTWTPYAEEVYDTMLNWRYARLMPTLFTTNLSPSVLGHHVPRLLSRLTEPLFGELIEVRRG